jgi:site-specific recombinase XerD
VATLMGHANDTTLNVYTQLLDHSLRGGRKGRI